MDQVEYFNDSRGVQTFIGDHVLVIKGNYLMQESEVTKIHVDSFGVEWLFLETVGTWFTPEYLEKYD